MTRLLFERPQSFASLGPESRALVAVGKSASLTSWHAWSAQCSAPDIRAARVTVPLIREGPNTN